MLTKEHLAMGGREGKYLRFVNFGSFPPATLVILSSQIFQPGNFGLELDADLSSGRSSGDIDTFLCIQMTKV